jgi:peptidoglycan lytic transglycosylase G
MKTATRRSIFGLLILILLVVLSASYYIYRLMVTPYKAYAEPKISVEIPRGSSIDWISNTLHEKGILRHPLLLKLVFKWKHTETQSKAGEYVFDQPLSPLQLYEKLMKGEISYTVLTIPEGSNVLDVERIMKDKNIPGAQDFETTLISRELLSELHSIDPSLQSPEGFLFPETYFVAKREDVLKILITMVREFKKRYGKEEERRASELGMSTVQVITLASLIEKETGKSKERPLISGVFHNRLRKSMLLQCDPTVIYGLLLAGEYHGFIKKSDLKYDSPYNTYVFPGLPPGPICNPGQASIRAALFPETTDKLYFVSRNDGSHYFSSTLEEHNRAVQQYQR